MAPGNVLAQARGPVANSAPLRKVKRVEGDGCELQLGQTVGIVDAGDHGGGGAADGDGHRVADRGADEEGDAGDGDHDHYHAAFAGLLGELRRIHAAHELPAREHRERAV